MPKGLISGMLNKGIEIKGFWSSFKLNFTRKNHCSYKRQEIVHNRLEKLFNTRQYKTFLFLFLVSLKKLRIETVVSDQPQCLINSFLENC